MRGDLPGLAVSRSGSARFSFGHPVLGHGRGSFRRVSVAAQMRYMVIVSAGFFHPVPEREAASDGKTGGALTVGAPRRRLPAQRMYLACAGAGSCAPRNEKGAFHDG